MLLDPLIEYSKQQAQPAPSLYIEGPVRYFINLDSTGRLLSPMVDTADTSDRRTSRGLRRLLPKVQRVSRIYPLLLADKADYTLGYAEDSEKMKWASDCHQAYVQLLERCAKETEEPDVQAVLDFLRSDPVDQLQDEDGFSCIDPSGVITFKVDGRTVIDNPAVQDFWASINSPNAREAEIMQCLACRQKRPVLERLQAKIKGIPGGLTSGMAIISASSDPFQSYGLHASLNAPICSPCAEGLTRGLNSLLASPQHRLPVNRSLSVVWTREPTEFNFLSALSDPKADQVEALLQTVLDGLWTPTDDGPLYVLSLSSAAGRAAVRNWLETTVKNAKQHLASWFQRQHIVLRTPADAHYYGIYPLVLATASTPRELPVTIPIALIRSAFSGTPVPWDILYHAVHRNRAERSVTRPRAALIKLVLLSRVYPSQQDHLVGLDPEDASPAYLCGRLLAVLEDAQRTSIRGLTTTIVDQAYGMASTAPQFVFPRLLKGSQVHLSTLQRYWPAARRAIQTRMEQILSRLEPTATFPKTLTLEEQGLFSLGYYHQRTDIRLQAQETARRQNRPRE